MRTRAQPLPVRRALPWLALLVLALGLPQLLVVCRSHDGDVHLEFVGDTHCDDESGQRGSRPLPAAPRPTGLPGMDVAPGCEHTALGADPAPPPRPDLQSAPPPSPGGAWAQLAHDPRDAALDARRCAPATGPPRSLRWRELRATRLLI